MLYRKILDPLAGIAAGLMGLAFLLTGCNDEGSSSEPPVTSAYEQVNLVADVAGYPGARIDPSLTNAWGIAIGGTGSLWVSSNHSGVSTIYDGNGNTTLPPVVIPSKDGATGGAPTGQIYNATADFALLAGPSKFIFAGEDGTISAWSPGATGATIVANRSASDAVYKGIAMASDGGNNFLYLANFKGGTIDVFDKNFGFVTGKPFHDTGIPTGYSPFNIQNIGGKLYVTYAKMKAPDNEDDEPGAGNGYVDIYNPDGSLVKRFASQGTLNSPWGIAIAPAGFGQFANATLIGNFGDGRINAFDSDGKYLGQLKDNNAHEISIDGLWGMTFGANGSNASWLYFAAGPQDEDHGLFGYVKLK